jgi:hypothetical protein
VTIENLYKRYNEKPIASFRDAFKEIQFEDIPSEFCKNIFLHVIEFCKSLDNLFVNLQVSENYFPDPNNDEIRPVYKAAINVYQAKALLNLLDQSEFKHKLLNFLRYFTDLIEEELYDVFGEAELDLDNIDSALDFANDCKNPSFLS